MELEDKAVKDKFILNEVYGNSMFPTLRSRDKVIAKKVLPEDLRCRDIIIFGRKDLKVCHRIVKIDRRKGLFYARGDFNLGGIEELKEEDIAGKVIAVISQNKLYPLKWQNTLLYCLWTKAFGFLKQMAIFLIDKVYRFRSVRKFLKHLSLYDIKCLLAKTDKERETFDTLYNFLPEQICHFSISERLLGFYKGRFVAKIWVLKDEDNNFWLWGPYVKVLYRARGIGTDLVKKALKIVFQTDTSASVCVLTSFKKSLLKFYEKFGFAPEVTSYGLPFNFVTLKNFKRSSVSL